MKTDLVIAAIDVGKLANVGWFRRTAVGDAVGGTDLDELTHLLSEDLDAGRPVALGFEAPMWVPLPKTTAGLGKGRPGEGNRAWGASAGATVLACGLQQAAFVLAGVAESVSRMPRVTLDPEAVTAGDADLVVWEAFVSAGSKDRTAMEPHVSDARAAVLEYARRSATGQVNSDIVGTTVVSIAGLALLASGLSTDPAIATRPCPVVKAPILSPARTHSR